ncbi:P-loop containing nucleoside triphosphate hydrolase protein [Pilobolus umbonatus]|nr:P-loop containing nucleoside triphosphate hydrolase protein [Pilobolus umbonatus]
MPITRRSVTRSQNPDNSTKKTPKKQESGSSSDEYSSDEESSEDNQPPPKRTRTATSLKSTTTKRKPLIASKRRIHRVNQIASVTPLRQVNHHSSVEKSDYDLAKERLHVSAVPESLPCREEEFETIMEYVKSAIQDNSGTCIYISGVPGTGKTATVLEVMKHLQEKAEEGSIPNFDFVEINGMKLTDPNQAYSILWESIEKSNKKNSGDNSKRKYTAIHALQLLESKFTNQTWDSQRTTVVLMDELDLLATKKLSVLYNFFDWPGRPFSKLIVVAIANTMDLPERLSNNKIASRIGMTRINFQPYRYDQLIQIVQSRLEGIKAFAKEAIEFASRKVSAVSGDARRALDICRRAVEIIETRNRNKKGNDAVPSHVTISVVDEAIKEMYTSPIMSFIKSCSLHQKLFLVACMQSTRSSGIAEVEMGDVIHNHSQICRWHFIEPPSSSDYMRICESLGESRAIIMESNRRDIFMRISLNVNEEDIIMACTADPSIFKLVRTLLNRD